MNPNAMQTPPHLGVNETAGHEIRSIGVTGGSNRTPHLRCGRLPASGAPYHLIAKIRPDHYIAPNALLGNNDDLLASAANCGRQTPRRTIEAFLFPETVQPQVLTCVLPVDH